jgi:hypothetical protein
MEKSYLHLTAAQGFPIGIRRNNPGNLASSVSARSTYLGITSRPDVGRGPLFLAFVNMAYGLLAMSQLMTAYIGSKGLNTITKMAPKYTGEAANSAKAKEWIRDVSRYSGLAATKVLNASNPDQLKNLCLGIVQKEVGLKWNKSGVTATITSADYDEGQMLRINSQIA